MGFLYSIASTMSHLRMKDLAEKDKNGLLKQLNEYKKELSQLRVAQVMSNTASKVGKIGTMRKNIARILTVLNTKERQNLRKLYAEPEDDAAEVAAPEAHAQAPPR